MCYFLWFRYLEKSERITQLSCIYFLYYEMNFIVYVIYLNSFDTFVGKRRRGVILFCN